jgi:hypothetical protein
MASHGGPAYERFVDELVRIATSSAIVNRIHKSGHPVRPNEADLALNDAEQRIKAIFLRLSIEDRSALADALMKERQAGLHDFAAFLEGEIAGGDMTISWEGHEIGAGYNTMHGDFIGRLEGDDWSRYRLVPADAGSAQPTRQAGGLVMPLSGGCLCGAVRYSYEGSVAKAVYCHCSDCRRTTGSAFNVGLGVSAAGLSVTGALERFTKCGDSGTELTRHFCGACGSPLFTTSPKHAQTVFLKAGSLDDSSVVVPGAESWVSSAVPWSRIAPDLPQFDRGRA